MYSGGSQPEQAQDKQEEPDPPPPRTSGSVSVTPSRRSIFKAASARKRTMRGEGRREEGRLGNASAAEDHRIHVR